MPLRTSAMTWRVLWSATAAGSIVMGAQGRANPDDVCRFVAVWQIARTHDRIENLRGPEVRDVDVGIAFAVGRVWSAGGDFDHGRHGTIRPEFRPLRELPLFWITRFRRAPMRIR